MNIINPYKRFQGAFIPNALMEYKEISQSAKLMWARLAQYSGRDGRCFPKIERLADDIGLSRSMARKVIKELQDGGFIFVKHAVGKDKLMHKASEYFFLDHEVFHSHDMDETVFSGEPKNGPSGKPKNGPSLEGPKMGCPIEENQLRESELNLVPGKTPGDDLKKSKKYHGSDEDYKLAQQIFLAVQVVNSTVNVPNWDKWANDIRLMRVQDKRSHAEIWHAFDFANRDPFWQNNVLSTGALRRHYVKLAPKAGMAKSQVRGVTADVVDNGTGKTCGNCVFAGQGKKICNGDDADANHAACELFRPASEEV